MLERYVIRGSQRNYYALPIILICVLASVTAGALVAGLAAKLTVDSTNATVYENSLDNCHGIATALNESNRRISSHVRDRDNLAKLAQKLSENRAAEASTFAAIGGAFDIERKVDPLVRLLRLAAQEDQQIADTQRQVKFDRLEPIDCEKVIREP